MASVAPRKRDLPRRTLEHSLSAEDLGRKYQQLFAPFPTSETQYFGSSKQTRESTKSVVPPRRQTRAPSVSVVLSTRSGASSSNPPHTPPRKFDAVKRKPVPPLDIPLKKSPSPSNSPLKDRTRTLSSGSDSCSKYSNWHSPSHRAQLQTSAPSSTKKQNGNTSDGSTAISVDMKRLLSKPALPTSSASVLSIQSDSEAHSGTHKPSPLAGSTLASTSRNTLDGNKHAQPKVPSRLQEVIRAKEKQRAASTSALEKDRASRLGSSRESSTDRKPALPDRDRAAKPPRPRNVLRRRSSANRDGSTPSAQRSAPESSPAINTPIYIAHRRVTAPTLTVDSTLRPHPLSSAPNSSSGSTKSKSPHSPSPVLTPAGAVAEAYKQQEQRREILASQSRSSEEKLVVGSGTDRKSDGGDRSPIPYFTVVGSTTGRIVAVGGPSDDTWDVNLDAYVMPEVLNHSRSAITGSLRRNLSRKVSGKWKKVVGGGRESVDSARPAIRERHSTSFAHERRTSMQIPLEKAIDLTPQKPSSVPTTLSRHGSKKVKVKVESKKADNEPHSQKADSSQQGGKIWKLVKRLSSGVLRDRFLQEPEAPPPVPPLPKDIHKQGDGLRSNDGHGETSPGGLLRFMQPRSSIAMSPKLSGGPQKTTTPSKTTPGKNSLGLSTMTGPPSPVSSDVASAQFFHRTQSARSSSSSYGDEIPPPVPNTIIGKHIIPPSELYRFCADEGLLSSLQHGRWTPPGSSPERLSPKSDSQTSLPFPPRRLNTGSSDAGSHDHPPPSPAIPIFTTAQAINTFGHSHLPTVGDTRVIRKRPSLSLMMPESEPPARPRRSTLRGPPPTTRSADTEVARGANSLRNPNRISSSTHSDASTTRQRPRSNSLGSLPHAGVMVRSPLTFRELSAGAKSGLTEKEKAERWDDLLERSARAGGTLHLGEAGLASDMVRFSDYSEAGA
jgi:hypothetical protein